MVRFFTRRVYVYTAWAMFLALNMLVLPSIASAEEEGMQAVPESVISTPTQETEKNTPYYPPESQQAESKPLMQPIKTLEEQKSQDNSSISLMADASLITPISIIAREFSREKHVPVALEFGSTKEQVDKILGGAEANVFISVQPLWIKKLQDNGLIDVYSRTNIARNTLVVAAPLYVSSFDLSLKRKKQNKKYFPLGDEEFKFGFADAQLLAEGNYLIESMNMLELDNEMKMHYSLFKDMFSMAHAIEEFGFYGAMFKSDTYLHPKLHAVSTFPDNAHNPITYQAVVVAGEHMDEARRFIAYLKTSEAKAIFNRYGFEDVAPELTAN